MGCFRFASACIVLLVAVISLVLGIFFVVQTDAAFIASPYFLSPTLCRRPEGVYVISNATRRCGRNRTSSSQIIKLTDNFIPDDNTFFPELVVTASDISGTVYFILSDSTGKIALDSSINSGDPNSEKLELDSFNVYHPGALPPQFNASCQKKKEGCKYVPSSEMKLFKDEDATFDSSDFTLPFTIEFTQQTQITSTADPQSVPDIFLRFTTDTYLSDLQIAGIILICVSPVILLISIKIDPEAYETLFECVGD